MRRFICTAWIAAIAVVAVTSAAPAGIITTYDAAGVQASTASNITVENFDGFTTGDHTSLSTAIGTFDYATIAAANVFGGAGGTGNFLYPGANNGSVSTLTLTSSQTYFGFWWSAADTNNTIAFYNGTTLVASFDPTTALGALAGNPAYYGNPNTMNNSGDSGQIFAFMNIYFTGTDSFNKIVVTGSTFESDNWTISDDPGGMGGTPIGSTPEPASVTMLCVGSLGLMGYRWRRKRHAAMVTA